MYKRILLAYDGSESGQKALLDCQDIAHMGNADLFLIAVRPPPSALIGGEGGLYDPRFEEQEEKQYREILDDGLKRLESTHRPTQGEVLVGDAVDEITAYANKVNADLIVVGHRHRKSWAARWWQGSISKTLIEHSPCSVLVVITN